MKKTKVVCTMGPNTNDRELMKKLIENGMDVARFNFSHGDHEEQKGRMDLLKELREELNTNTAILLDTKGPEIRTGVLKDGKKITLEAGAQFVLTVDEIVGDQNKVSITYDGLVQDVDAGKVILIDDGLIALKVKQTEILSVRLSMAANSARRKGSMYRTWRSGCRRSPRRIRMISVSAWSRALTLSRLLLSEMQSVCLRSKHS